MKTININTNSNIFASLGLVYKNSFFKDVVEQFIIPELNSMNNLTYQRFAEYKKSETSTSTSDKYFWVFEMSGYSNISLVLYSSWAQSSSADSEDDQVLLSFAFIVNDLIDTMISTGVISHRGVFTSSEMMSFTKLADKEYVLNLTMKLEILEENGNFKGILTNGKTTGLIDAVMFLVDGCHGEKITVRGYYSKDDRTVTYDSNVAVSTDIAAEGARSLFSEDECLVKKLEINHNKSILCNAENVFLIYNSLITATHTLIDVDGVRYVHLGRNRFMKY